MLAAVKNPRRRGTNIERDKHGRRRQAADSAQRPGDRALRAPVGRGVATSEAGIRASLCLISLTGAPVAVGFIAQIGDRIGQLGQQRHH